MTGDAGPDLVTQLQAKGALTVGAPPFNLREWAALPLAHCGAAAVQDRPMENLP